MVGKPDEQIYMNEFESDWVTHSVGFVSHLTKTN